MAHPIDDVKNWMHCFRWVVKTIRDDYGIDEAILTRNAVLEADIGLSPEKLEDLLETISQAFSISYPASVLDEVLKLEELCLLTAWLKGFYKRPDFISDGFEATCRAQNAGAGA